MKTRLIRSFKPGGQMKTRYRTALIFGSAIATGSCICVPSPANGECPGDGTNSVVVAEYLFIEGVGGVTINTGIDGEDGDAELIYGADFDTDVPSPNDSCGWSIQLPSSGSGSTTPAVETSTEYDPMAGASNFTIMAWVRRESGAANQNTSARIVSDTSSTSLSTNTAGVEFRFAGSSGTLSLRINGNEVSTTVGGVAPNSDAWHHVAVVYDGSRPATNTLTRNVHFYVDGVQRGDGNVLQDAVVAENANRLTLGNSAVSRGVGNLLVGKIDNVIILNGFSPDAVGNGQTNETIMCFRDRPDDIEPPIISCPNDVMIEADSGECFSTAVNLGTPMVTDNCGVADVTNNAPTSFPVGITYVVWTAYDEAGNYNGCTQSVTVLDVESPSIICPSNLTFEAGPCLAAVTNVSLGSPVVSDLCGSYSVVSVAPSEYEVGTNIVVWNAWDAHGNTNSCQQLVIVYANETADCDGDGLTDYEEVHVYGTDPMNPSTAEDGLSDGWKVQYGFDPTVPVPEECRPKYW